MRFRAHGKGTRSVRNVWKAWVIFCGVAMLPAQSAAAQSEAEPLYLQCKSPSASAGNAYLREFILKVGSIYNIDDVKTRVLERWEDDEWKIWARENVTVTPTKIAYFTWAGADQKKLALWDGIGSITKHVEFEIDRRDGQFTFVNYLVLPKVTGTCTKIAEPKPPVTKF